MVLASGIFVACNKKENILNKTKATHLKSGVVSPQSEAIPIAQVNEKGEIELLFSQSELQQYFMNETGNQLIFADIVDDNLSEENSNCYFLINSINEKTEEKEGIAYSNIRPLREIIYSLSSGYKLRQ